MTVMKMAKASIYNENEIMPNGEESYVYFHIEPKYTNYVNRILEGYEYVGVMTTVNSTGRCMVRSTEDTKPLAIEILSSLPMVTLEE